MVKPGKFILTSHIWHQALWTTSYGCRETWLNIKSQLAAWPSLAPSGVYLMRACSHYGEPTTKILEKMDYSQNWQQNLLTTLNAHFY